MISKFSVKRQGRGKDAPGQTFEILVRTYDPDGTLQGFSIVHILADSTRDEANRFASLLNQAWQAFEGGRDAILVDPQNQNEEWFANATAPPPAPKVDEILPYKPHEARESFIALSALHEKQRAELRQTEIRMLILFNDMPGSKVTDLVQHLSKQIQNQ